MAQASATVELKGDDAQLTAALQESERNVSSFGTKLIAAFTGITAAISVAGVIKDAFGGIGDVFKGFIDGAAKAEESEARLGAVIKATGGAAGLSKEQLVAFADSLEAVTKFESEATQGAMGVIATFKNIRGDQFLEATKLAQDMATVMGTDVTSSAMQVAKALNDPLQGINALRRAGVSFTEEQKTMIDQMLKAGDVVGAQRVILNELSAEFGGAAEAVGDTFNGSLEILANQLGMVTDQIGGAFIEAFQSLGPVIDDTITVLGNLAPIFVEIIQSAFELGRSIYEAMKPTLGWLADETLHAFSTLQAMWDNWRDTAKLALLSVALSIEKFWETTKYTFVEVLPAALTWLADNWYNILVDMANVTGTIFDNMMKNIIDFGASIYNFLNGKDFDFKFTALLDGFEATVSEFPKIAARVKSETEKALEQEIGETATNIAESAIEHYEKNKKFIDDLLVKKKKDEVDMTPAAGIEDYDLEGFKTKKEPKEKKKKAEKKKAEKGKKEEKSDAGSVEGLTDLAKRIQSASAKSPEAEAAKATKEAVVKVEEKVEEKGNEEVEAVKEVKDSVDDLADATNNEGDDSIQASIEEYEHQMLEDFSRAQISTEKHQARMVDLTQRYTADVADLVKVNRRMLEVMLSVNTDTGLINKNTAKPNALI